MVAADELTIRTFANLNVSLDRHLQTSSVRVLLYRLAYEAVRTWNGGRRWWNRTPLRPPAPITVTPPDNEATVVPAFQRLSMLHRCVMVLHDVERLEIDLIAEAIRCPRDEVRKLLLEARSQFGRAIDGAVENDPLQDLSTGETGL